jgi:uncharacterized membrane protein
MSRTPAASVALIALLSLPATAFAGEGGFSFWTLLGRLHVVVVHFPVALLLVLGFIEVLRWLRRIPGPDATVTLLVVLAALSAVVSTVMGWAQADGMGNGSGREAQLIFQHRWLGVTTTALALVLAAVALRRQLGDGPRLTLAYRLLLLPTCALVGLTGHIGGSVVHGEDYFTSALPACLRPAEADGSNEINQLPVVWKKGEKVDFMRDIEPLFKDACYECHNDKKQKGDLRMDSREALLKGGENGAAIVPGDGAKSLLMERILGKGDDPRMPKKKPQLSEAQNVLVQTWIDQGAPWGPAK